MTLSLVYFGLDGAAAARARIDSTASELRYHVTLQQADAQDSVI